MLTPSFPHFSLPFLPIPLIPRSPHSLTHTLPDFQLSTLPFFLLHIFPPFLCFPLFLFILSLLAVSHCSSFVPLFRHTYSTRPDAAFLFCPSPHVHIPAGFHLSLLSPLFCARHGCRHYPAGFARGKLSTFHCSEAHVVKPS